MVRSPPCWADGRDAPVVFRRRVRRPRQSRQSRVGGSGEVTEGLSSRDTAVVCVYVCRVVNQEDDLVGDRLAVEKELGVGAENRESWVE